jgi:hypothetical protein
LEIKTIAMKTKFTLMVMVLFMPCRLLLSQTEYFYPLTSSFQAIQQDAPALIQIPNDQSATGSFVNRPIPASTCGTSGQAPGYFFADDAGLQFNDPAGFIDQAYSLALNFQMDEFISPPGWVRLLSFTHIDDVGLYIKLTDPPSHGTLEFWPYGTVGQQDFFSPTDFYQMILVRNAAGLITVYINGQQFAQYDDSISQAYVPKDPSNFIVFFRDDPSVLAGEASPGFVSSIRITNEAWSVTKVQTLWSQFCSSLMGVDTPEKTRCNLYPNPVSDVLNLSRVTNDMVNYTLIDISGKTRLSGITAGSLTKINLHGLSSGMYWVKIEEEQGPVFIKLVKE